MGVCACVCVCGFDGVRCRYFDDKVISREDVSGSVRQLSNDKSAEIDGIPGEIIFNGVQVVIDLMRELCNKAFVEGIVKKD